MDTVRLSMNMHKRVIITLRHEYEQVLEKQVTKICIYTFKTYCCYNNFNKKYCRMNELFCSHCSVLCFKCTNYTELKKWVQLTCQNCAINGNMKEHAKKTFNLIEQAVLQKVVDEKIKLGNELNEYKKQFNRSQNVVYSSLIKQETYKFAQDFVAFKEDITKEQSQLQRTVKECQERILNLTENQTKRCIINEVKELNKNLQKKLDINRANVEKVNEASKEYRNRLTNLLFASIGQGQNPREGKTIFTPEEINIVMAGYIKKINDMDRKAENLKKLCQQGDHMLTAQTSLVEAPKPKQEEKVLKVEEMEDDQQQ